MVCRSLASVWVRQASPGALSLANPGLPPRIREQLGAAGIGVQLVWGCWLYQGAASVGVHLVLAVAGHCLMGDGNSVPPRALQCSLESLSTILPRDGIWEPLGQPRGARAASAPALEQEACAGQHINRWVWQCANKTLFIKTGAGPWVTIG